MSESSAEENVQVQTQEKPEDKANYVAPEEGGVELDKDPMAKLEADLVRLDKSLEDVLMQMDSVKKTKDELFATSRKLEQTLELSGGNNEVDEKQQEKLKAMLTDIRKREEIVKELEKRELVLSHSMVGVISNWADEVERLLVPQQSRPMLQPEVEPQDESLENKQTVSKHGL